MNKRKVSPAYTIFGIVAAILLIAIIGLTAGSVAEINRLAKGGRSYSYKASDYLYGIKNGDFSTVIGNMDYDDPDNSDTAQYQALGKYYEQSMIFEALKAQGESEESAKVKALMDRYEADAGPAMEYLE